MRIVVQRVKNASCLVEGKVVSQIEKGLLLYIGFTEGDQNLDLDYYCRKVYKLRIFEDENGKMNKDITAHNGEILAISQFTLYGDITNGNRPAFVSAMQFDKANSLYMNFITKMNNLVTTKGGVFGADMKINYTNDGPVTLIIDSNDFRH